MSQLGTHAERVNILVVDDEPANVLALEVVLADLGQNVVRAGSWKRTSRSSSWTCGCPG